MKVEFIDPGQFRTELELQSPHETPDGMGGSETSWTNVGLVFARIEPVRARSWFGAYQHRETITHRITMRTRIDVSAGRRLVRGQRVFAIATVHDPDESGRYLVCEVEERRP